MSKCTQDAFTKTSTRTKFMFPNIPGSANLPQELMEAQDLSGEDPGTDEDAGHEAEEASEVLGSDLPQVHRNHTEGYAWARTWGEDTVRVSSTQQTGRECAYRVEKLGLCS